MRVSNASKAHFELQDFSSGINDLMGCSRISYHIEADKIVVQYHP